MIAKSRASNESLSPAELLDAATDAHHQDRLEDAIQLLRQYHGMVDWNARPSPLESADLEALLLLPLYLHEAGQRGDAWHELDALRTRATTDLPPHAACVVKSDIEDTERFLLQRDGRAVEAVTKGILSVISWARGLYFQRRLEELEAYCTPANVMSLILPLLIQARLPALLEPVTQLVMELLAEVPEEQGAELQAQLVEMPGWPTGGNRLAAATQQLGIPEGRLATG